MESVAQKGYPPFVENPPRLFCDLPGATSHDFDALKSVSSRSRGSTLFREGQPARGIFVLYDGRAKLSVCSQSGKQMLLRIAGPGEILGLSAALAGTPHEVTAELLDDTQVAVVKRRDLLQFLHAHREACLQVVNLLSQDLHVAYDRVRALGLGRSRRSRSSDVH
jgi:CRP/FNR family transcriptional regulator, cyclic AMP receptor protein